MFEEMGYWTHKIIRHRLGCFDFILYHRPTVYIKTRDHVTTVCDMKWHPFGQANHRFFKDDSDNENVCTNKSISRYRNLSKLPRRQNDRELSVQQKSFARRWERHHDGLKRQGGMVQIDVQLALGVAEVAESVLQFRLLAISVRKETAHSAPRLLGWADSL